MTSSRAGRGFTLLEILVALLIGAMIIGAGRQLFDAAVDAQDRLQSAVTRTAASRAAISEIQRAVRTSRASASTPFIGSPDRVSFEGWCPDGYNGRARCVVQIFAAPMLIIDEQLMSGSHHTWIADSSGGRLDFVVDASMSKATVNEWESISSTPLAVRWVSRGTSAGATDTLLFEITRSAP